MDYAKAFHLVAKASKEAAAPCILIAREKIMEDGKEIEVVGEKLIVPSVNHLIALKLHAIRHSQKNRIWKDLPDVIRLIKMNGIDCKNKGFKDLCLKYGTSKIYQTILKNCS